MYLQSDEPVGAALDFGVVRSGRSSTALTSEATLRVNVLHESITIKCGENQEYVIGRQLWTV